jgi:uncharacterized OsmC-like protein
MADIEVTSTSTAGYTTRSEIGEWEMTIDATDQEGPNPNAVLVANYASCFIPALRVAASETGVDDLGTIDIEVSADLDEDDDLESIAFDLSVEGSLDADTDLIARAEEICHVHAALREELQAEVTLK